ncbi:MAG: 30S ribosomal protein S3, partial [Kiloniellales bacterium]|nr:30S ribosomal protein S3 [Kiloniellales bacterium]
AKWYARRDFADLLEEDLKLRKYLKKKLAYAGVSNIEIERSSGRVRVRIFTARPGVIIGRRGQEIDKVKEDLAVLTNNEVFVDIKEVKSPQSDAQLVAENVAMQLEKRVAFRRAMKKAVQLAMQKGALGIKIAAKGRLGGAEIAREEGKAAKAKTAKAGEKEPKAKKGASKQAATAKSSDAKPVARAKPSAKPKKAAAKTKG